MEDPGVTKSGEETEELAFQLFKKFGAGKLWLLYGDLGAGKTTFVKGLGRALGIPKAKIKSPTFTFVSEFENLIHYDLYRLEKSDESISELLREHLKTDKTIVIEWPELMEHELLIPHIKIRFTHLGKDKREIKITPHLF